MSLSGDDLTDDEEDDSDKKPAVVPNRLRSNDKDDDADKKPVAVRKKLPPSNLLLPSHKERAAPAAETPGKNKLGFNDFSAIVKEKTTLTQKPWCYPLLKLVSTLKPLLHLPLGHENQVWTWLI